jgi:DNA-binding Lrp family transcriptional regulator
MGYSIVETDMHLRDQRVLEYLQEATRAGQRQISHERIAARFACHRNTARAIVRRLEAAGFIAVDKTAKRGGYTYKAIPHASARS